MFIHIEKKFQREKSQSMFIAVAAAVDAVVFAWSLKRELLIDSKTSHSKTKNVFYILV